MKIRYTNLMNFICLTKRQYETYKRIQLISMGFLLLISLDLASIAPVFQHNLSYIGNTLGHRLRLLLWGVSSAVYFYSSFLTLSHQNQWVLKWYQRVCQLSCIMMVLSTILPYYDDAMPFISFLHLCCAMGGTVLYIVCYMIVLYDFQYENRTFYQYSMSGYLIILLLCFLFIVTFHSVNTISEIIFTTILPLFQYHLLSKIEKSETCHTHFTNVQ